MREKAEKWLHVKPGRKASSDNFHDSTSMANFPMHHSDKNSLSTEVVRHRNSFAAPPTPSLVSQNTTLVSIPLSRPTSIASSSGFASIGSQNVNSALVNTFVIFYPVILITNPIFRMNKHLLIIFL